MRNSHRIPLHRSRDNLQAVTPSAFRSWCGIGMLALAVFLVTSTEIMPVGLLPDISEGFSVSSGAAGQSLFYYGVVAGFSAPILTTLTRSHDRKFTLLMILGVFAIGNLLCVLVLTYGQFLAVRFTIGLLHGLLWSIVGNCALLIAPPGREVRATTIVFSGISLATVLGIPAGVLIGSSLGWRGVFVCLSGFCALLTVLFAVFMPSLRSRSEPARREASLQWRSSRLLVAFAATGALVLGYYSSYTYLRPLLSEVVGISAQATPTILVVFGFAGIVGNILGGISIEKCGATRTLCVCGVLCALVLYATATVPAPLLVRSAGLLLWGGFYSVLPIALQTFVLQSSPRAREAASSVYVLIFNVAIGIGAYAGGVLLDLRGIRTVVFGSVVFLLLGSITVATYRRHVTRKGHPFLETYDPLDCPSDR